LGLRTSMRAVVFGTRSELTSLEERYAHDDGSPSRSSPYVIFASCIGADAACYPWINPIRRGEDAYRETRRIAGFDQRDQGLRVWMSHEVGWIAL
jgi:hypothetical protein